MPESSLESECASPYVRNGDTQIYYEIRGKGYPIVFIHGFFGLIEHWKDQIPFFSPRYRVIAYDLRGMGRSDKPIQEVYTIAEDARDLDAVLAAAEVDRAVLIGHSKGGAVALEYCLRHPEKVAALVLASAFASGSHLPAMKEDEEKKTLEDLAKREEYHASSLGEELRKSRPEIFRWAIDEGQKMPSHAAVACSKGFRKHWDVTKELDRIRVPTLLVWGDRDLLTPLEPSQNTLLRRILNSRLAVMQGARHVIMLNDPQQFNMIVQDFLSSLKLK